MIVPVHIAASCSLAWPLLPGSAQLQRFLGVELGQLKSEQLELGQLELGTA